MLLPTVRSRCIRLVFAEHDSRRPEDPDACAVAERVLARAAATSDAARRLEGAKELLAGIGSSRAGDREQMAGYLRAMASLVRDAALVATGTDSSALANRDAGPALERLAAVYRGERGARVFAAIDRALEALKGNAGVKVLADWVVLQL